MSLTRDALLELVETSPVLLRIAEALERIADAFERPGQTAACAHAVEMRTDYSTMGHVGRYVCDPSKGGCGYQNF
jgi:hypothetical protein